MKLRIFYPAAFLLTIGMVFFAMKPGLERLQAWRETLSAIPETGLKIEGAGLGAIVVNERASVELLTENDESYVVIGSSGVVSNDDANGAHYFVPPEAVHVLLGTEVDVAFDVRAAPEGGSLEWLARAVIPQVMDTGWLPLTAGTDWSTVSLRVVIPPQIEVKEPMGLMMWSDAKGDGGRVELREILIRLAPVREASRATSDRGM